MGLIMGLTGAGGALAAIPLLIGLLSLSLRDATTLSLVIVIMSTLINLIGLRPKLNLRLVLTLVSAGAIGNVLSVNKKNEIPDYVVATLIISIGIYGLLSVWRERRELGAKQEKQGPIKSVIIGLLLGILTTLTGLGGGVVLMPVLMNFFGMNYQEALGNGLASILLISVMSFIFQWGEVSSLISLSELALITFGSFISVLLIKKLPPEMLKFRKILFTLVVVYSTVSIMRSVWI
ncbi:sulfite exporter TauE/SafE family protein [Peredibacter starrii]|uniref:sulfite exporter TauE/SafE family protein n=1 Tax=Peredibacter starrii TaxID=28202 RepID=UPI00389A9B85